MLEKLTLHEITPTELKTILRELMQTEFAELQLQLEQSLGADDLVSTGTACRILGVCSKVLKVLADKGTFTVYHHLKDRRYSRGELLEYRNRFRSNKKKLA